MATIVSCSGVDRDGSREDDQKSQADGAQREEHLGKGDALYLS